MVSKSDIVQLLTIGDSEIIGSAADDSILYTSDIDIQEFITIESNNLPSLWKEFQHIFHVSKQNQHIFLMDFKCGVMHSNIPIRWDYGTIMKGYQIIENKKILFMDTLQQQSTIKIDIIALIDGEYTEFSNNYYITVHFDNGRLLQTYSGDTNTQAIELSLTLDIQHYRKEHNYYKMLKRIMSLRKLRNEDNTQLINFFNGPIGKLNHQNNALHIIAAVMDNTVHRPQKADIQSNIRKIVSQLDTTHRKTIKSLFKKETLRKFIDDAIAILEPTINQGVLQWLTQTQK
jgi:hypothetical protein